MSDHQIEIIYRDQHLVAINKPHGLLVHRTKIAASADVFALQLLRNELNQKVFPVHRIDRKTAGVLLFALNEDADARMKMLFRQQEIEKTYLAIVRGFAEEEGLIDYPLRKESGQLQEAVTHYRTLQRTEIDLPYGKFATSRYSLLQIKPQTGRMHQIRKHMAHINHPIIADRPHGCNKQNKLFKEKWAMDSMMLHAKNLAFRHPYAEEWLNIEATISSEFERTMHFLNFKMNKQKLHD